MPDVCGGREGTRIVLVVPFSQTSRGSTAAVEPRLFSYLRDLPLEIGGVLLEVDATSRLFGMFHAAIHGGMSTRFVSVDFESANRRG
jgi:hypothetical protein